MFFFGSISIKITTHFMFCVIYFVFTNISFCVCLCVFFLMNRVTNYKQGVESNFVRYDRNKYRSRAQLQMIPADEPITTTMSFYAVTNIIRKNHTNTLHFFTSIKSYNFAISRLRLMVMLCTFFFLPWFHYFCCEHTIFCSLDWHSQWVQKSRCQQISTKCECM